jgi:hypothetical protein
MSVRNPQRPSTNDDTTALRQEGRQRLLQAGWQPAERTASNAAETVAVPADGNAQSNLDDRGTSESSARRRYRTAKERRPVEVEASQNSSPFEETPNEITERDLAHAQTPFHTEN